MTALRHLAQLRRDLAELGRALAADAAALTRDMSADLAALRRDPK